MGRQVSDDDIISALIATWGGGGGHTTPVSWLRLRVDLWTRPASDTRMDNSQDRTGTTWNQLAGTRLAALSRSAGVAEILHLVMNVRLASGGGTGESRAPNAGILVWRSWTLVVSPRKTRSSKRFSHWRRVGVRR